MAMCGACCGDEGKGEVAPVETKAAGVGFNMPLDKALGGPGNMREEEAVADAKKRQEEVEPVVAKTESQISAKEPKPPHSTAAASNQDVAAGSVKVRPSEVFNVEIPKGDRRMCIDINFHDHKTLLLTKVNPGPVEDFNRADPSNEIAPGDRIEAVNGEEGDTQSMLDACKVATTLKLRVRRCEEKTITLRKGDASSKLGMSCQIVDGMTLIVTKIDDDGLVSEHNAANPDHAIESEDRIIAVNGVRSNASKLDEELGQAIITWELVVRRIWPDEE